MGTYDELEFLNGAPRCAQGHAIESVQTKDLGAELGRYLVSDGHVFEPTPFIRTGLIQHPDGTAGEAVAVVTARYHLARGFNRYNKSGLTIYAGCDQCDPVFTSDGAWRDRVADHHPWCEWEMEMNGAVIVAIKPIRLDSREDLKKRLGSGRGDVLPDDDKIVIQEIKRHRSTLENTEPK